MQQKLEELQKSLGDAINEALRCEAVSEAIGRIQEAGIEIKNVQLELTVGRAPLRVPVPVDPSARWLEALYQLQDRRGSR